MNQLLKIKSESCFSGVTRKSTKLKGSASKAEITASVWSLNHGSWLCFAKTIPIFTSSGINYRTARRNFGLRVASDKARINTRLSRGSFLQYTHASIFLHSGRRRRLAALSSANSFPRPSGFHRYSPRAIDIDWQPCEEDLDKQCGRFEIPLDYHNESAGKASLAVARHPATKGPKLGTIFLNPGGPGGSGVDLILGGNSEKVMQTVSGRYDLVSWDPRGVGESDLQPACFVSRAEENIFWNGSIARVGIEARGNFTDQTDLDAFYAQVPAVDELLSEFGQRCHKLSPDVLQYVGTAATVRDMVALHDYLEGSDKPIDYWGMSYGTIVGVYFVNMFPDRVGRVVLDGVVDPLNCVCKIEFPRRALTSAQNLPEQTSHPPWM
ncbi:hypothetical protein FRC12_021173 [Ceratobasidium sp. 428]|nr:hypothetical protein FRC12_021173 [Ceratobasidium sp. 428]